MGKQQPLKERLVALLYRLAKRDTHGFFAVPVDPELVSAQCGDHAGWWWRPVY
jgi:hypothetical protein